MTQFDKQRDQLTDENRKEIRKRLETAFEQGIADTKESHLRQLAQDAVYDRFGIGYAMGLWNSFDMGDDYGEYEHLKIRMAKNVGVAPDELFAHLEQLVQKQAVELSDTFDIGQFGKNLEDLKAFALSKIDATESVYAASYLQIAASDFIAASVRAHPLDQPRDALSEIRAMSWIGMERENIPMRALGYPASQDEIEVVNAVQRSDTAYAGDDENPF